MHKIDVSEKMNKQLSTLQKGFTLIELLIVIAVLGILAAGVLVAVDPVDRIRSGEDSRVQNDIGTIGRAAEAYATSARGRYPDAIADMLTNGDLKNDLIAVRPAGRLYSMHAFNNPSITATCDEDPIDDTPTLACTGLMVAGTLLSNKYTARCTNAGEFPFWVYNSETGESCAVCQADVAAAADPNTYFDPLTNTVTVTCARNN